MEQENILIIIDKLTDAKVTLQELETIKPLIGTTDFKETFEIVEVMEEALQPEGRAILKNELEEAAKEYFEEQKVIQLKSYNKFLLPCVAAALLIVCSVSVIHTLTDYNNPKYYRKAITENIK